MNEVIYILTHVADEGPALFGDCLEKLSRETSIVNLHQGDCLPDDLDSAAGVLVLGGPMNVYEEEKYPWLREEDRFIKAVIAAEIPFLGICLGAQLLAKARGAQISKALTAEVGWSKVRLTDAGRSDPLFRSLPQELPVFQWHEDTFAIPEDGVLLATSDVCLHQAFRVGSSAYGLQFHLEAGRDTVRTWIENHRDLGAVGTTKLDSKGVWGRARKHCTALATNFVRIIDSSARVRKIVSLYVGKPETRRVELWWDPKERTLLE